MNRWNVKYMHVIQGNRSVCWRIWALGKEETSINVSFLFCSLLDVNGVRILNFTRNIYIDHLMMPIKAWPTKSQWELQNYRHIHVNPHSVSCLLIINAEELSSAKDCEWQMKTVSRLVWICYEGVWHGEVLMTFSKRLHLSVQLYVEHLY